ncbi:unnamed protein product [Paramecium sonneborni]|uniref:Uncharacterized protein n=1 Tax=Paramecium sonneborni TaxID=65129 RepID=A0A8S1LRR2_9CILI|nr:unnamed protein product [Paramecium sonneborni]
MKNKKIKKDEAKLKKKGLKNKKQKVKIQIKKRRHECKLIKIIYKIQKFDSKAKVQNQ